MIWSGFASAAPKIAAEGKRRLGGLALVGTVRKDGAPRISPVEPFISSGHLLLGMMDSMKAMDLIRDPRCLVHNAVSDPEGSQGEFKVRGFAVPVKGKGLRNAYSRAYRAKWGRDPPPPFPTHLFSVDVREVVLVDWDTEGSAMIIKTWSPSRGVVAKKRGYP